MDSDDKSYLMCLQTLAVVSAILDIILPGMPKTVTVNLPASEGGGTRELRVRYLLSCDAKFASLYFSHQGSAATFFCIWCTISKDELLAAMETGDEAPARRARLAVDAAELFEHTRALEETVAAAAANAAPATTAQSSLPSPAATAQSSLPAPVTPTQSSLPSAASSSGIRLAAVRVAAAGAAELLKSYTLRTRAAMEEVGNKVSPYLNKPGSATLFDTARLLREYEAGTTATLAAAIECHVIKAQGRTKTRALSHVSKGLDMYRQSITAAPLSNVITIEDYRIEPLHAVINCINNLWELTEAFYEQLIGHYKGAWAAIMAEIGLHQHITNFNGKECQAVVDRRGEFLQHLSLHPMCGVLGRVWALMAILLWSLNVADMEQHTLAHFATYAAAADQLEYYISKYLSKPYPSPEQHDLSVFSPTCGTKEHPLVSMSVKQYDHALMHHALPMYIAEDVSIASAGSSWLEAGNSGWKDGLNFHTSGGGGWERERKDQMRQVLERMCVECHPDISKHVLAKKAYLCGICHLPKLGHTCTAKLLQRKAAAADMAADARSPAAELLPTLPPYGPWAPDFTEDQPAPPSPLFSSPGGQPVYNSLSHQPSPNPPPPFIASPSKGAMLDKLYKAVLNLSAADPDVVFPTQEEFMMVATVAIKCSLFEQHMLDDGLEVLMWVERENAKLAAVALTDAVLRKFDASQGHQL